MLFNSYEFIFVFLPLTLLGFGLVGAWGGARWALVWLTLASIGFYAWWNPIYVVLLLASLSANYWLGSLLALQASAHGRGSKAVLAAGIAGNLLVLGYFKYAGFFAHNLNEIAGTDIHFMNVILPLGISFITFQKIAFLADSWSGQVKRLDWLHFALFVCFFPQLIAGPIVHHAEIMPQFESKRFVTLRAENVAIGLTIFSMGLFKKAIIADGISAYANPVFAAASAGEPIHFFQAWGGALAYTFQLYFDFSGYSDMAVGGARMFGIVLPMNFSSPYKATSIIDFWRRWHMTLSRFLRDYVYKPLGGNRKGAARRYANLFATMAVGGLWHGAGWTFVAWGALHGGLLILNHGWRAVKERLGIAQFGERGLARLAAQILTFVAVVVGWVYFRAESFAGANAVVAGMLALHGVQMPSAIIQMLGSLGDAIVALGLAENGSSGTQFAWTWIWILAAGAIAFFAPNSMELMRSIGPVLDRPEGMERDSGLRWAMGPAWAAAIGIVFVLGVLALPEVTEFLYFQF